MGGLLNLDQMHVKLVQISFATENQVISKKSLILILKNYI
jgi:hypothetical protein